MRPEGGHHDSSGVAVAMVAARIPVEIANASGRYGTADR